MADAMRIVIQEETRRSWPAPWARRLATLALAVLVVGVAGHWRGFIATPPFFLVLWLALAMAIGAFMLIGAAMPKVWYLGFRGGRHLIVAGLIAGLVLIPYVAAGVWMVTHPSLTDISTDLEEPPLYDQALAVRTPDMNPLLLPSEAWREEQTYAYPTVGGRRYDIPIESVREAVEKVFEDRNWTMLGPYVVGSGLEFSIETTVYSPVLALPSDVVVRLVSDDDATFVDMRAAYRYGSADFGFNADLIVNFMSELDGAVSSLTRVTPDQ